MDDDALMKQAAAGDTQAFGCLVTAYQRRLLRFAHRMLGDAEAAEDAVQEAFLRLWAGRLRYRPQGRLEHLLLRIVRNACLDQARSRRNEEFAEDGAETSGFLADSLERQVEQRTLADAIRQAVQTLPEPQRAVFILSEYEGLSYAQIADVLDCPIGTVASRKHLAVAALRRRLETWTEEAGR